MRHAFSVLTVLIGHLADVGLDPDGAISELQDLLVERFGGFRMHDVIDNDIGALPGEFQHDGHADSAIATGDDGDFVFKVHRIWLIAFERMMALQAGV